MSKFGLEDPMDVGSRMPGLFLSLAVLYASAPSFQSEQLNPCLDECMYYSELVYSVVNI